MSFTDDDISTDPSDYSDLEVSEVSSPSCNESQSASLPAFNKLNNHSLTNLNHNIHSNNHYPMISQATIINLYDIPPIHPNLINNALNTYHNHTKSIKIESDNKSEMNTNHKPSTKQPNTNHSISQRRRVLQSLSLDELLAKTLICNVSFPWNIEWCRYCGARASRSFLSSPWGSNKLCYIHHNMWKKNELKLSTIPEPMNIKSVINKTECTEKQYLIDVLLQSKPQNIKNEYLSDLSSFESESESFYSSYESSSKTDDNMNINTVLKLEATTLPISNIKKEKKDYLNYLLLPIECTVCCDCFTTHSGFRYHMKHIHGINRAYKCMKCCDIKDIRYASKAGLHEHIERDHEKIRRFKCTLCPKAFYRKATLEKHQRVHDGKKPFKCSECDLRCSQKSSLRQHIIAVHLKQRNYKCKYCGKAFAASTTMKSHMVALHNDDKYSRFQCNKCHKKFYEKSSYLKHSEIAHKWSHPIQQMIKNGHCPYIDCNKRYESKNKAASVKYHLVTKHKDRRYANYECKKCKKLFYDKTTYTEHLQTKH